jgi:hypothetical protein
MDDILVEDFHPIANGCRITDVNDCHSRFWVPRYGSERVSGLIHTLRNSDRR